ncbi:MAG: Ig-like domain-containing protein [Oscillospiraceae bacterium]|nr:Ig-like domain-containing protein [Oscillospiraceae bacterium]MBP0989432.1 Ig-like domain-containing protein [Oscillospiraceae bacterium]
MSDSTTARIVRTITDLGYAKITAIDSDGKPTYGSVQWLPHHRAGGRSYDAQPAGTATGIWADGMEVYAAEDNQGYNNTVTTVGVTDDVEEDWYGYTVNGDTVEEYANGESYPYFALVIIEDTTDGVGKTTIFPYCHINQRSAQSGATSEGNGLNPQFPQHNIACRPRPDVMCCKMTIAGKQKISTIPEPSAAVPHVSIKEATATVTVGQTVALTIDGIYPPSAEITWSSGTQAKATVSSSGVVSGVAAGSSVITASITVGGTSYTDTCTVTVNAAPSP